MITFGKYDITLAVQARRVLMFEANTYEDCVRLVYKPTFLLLQELLLSDPRELVCLRTPIISGQNQLGTFCDVDIVALGNKIAHIGTVRDWAQSLENWSWFLKTYREYPEKVELLVRRGPMAIIRHQLRCDIPVQAKKLDRAALNEAVLKYFRTYLPEQDSEKPKIRWLSSKLQLEIEKEIHQEAKKSARTQTKNEKKKVFGFDI